jgi:maleamate amidohydrolase
VTNSFSRSWSAYLTDQDRAVLGATSWAKREPFGLGAKAAVLAVDLYYAALGERGVDAVTAVRDWPSACGPRGWDAVDRTVPVLDAARAADVPVVYFHAAPPELGRWNRKPVKAVDPVDPVRGNTIVAEVAPTPGDVVIRKTGPSAFHDTPLDTVLRSRGVDTVLVCGEATSGCVRSTVVDACSRGYRVGVIGDCCFDRFEASHWVSLFDLDQKYADVVPSAEVLAYLKGRPALS